MRLRPILRLAAPVLALALAAGCSDAGDASRDGGLPTLTEAGLYPVLTAANASDGETRLTLSLKQVPGGTELASVQGEIEYDAATLQLARTALPEGVEGDVEEVSPGRVRFVATLAQGAVDAPLLNLDFRGRDRPTAPAREMFQVRFEEVVGGADFADLTASVRPDHLLLVRSR